MASPFAAALPRVACPACGAAIHPIAGRCRHCRADLTRRRDDGPQTAAATAPARAHRPPARPRVAFVAMLLMAVALVLVTR